MSSVVDLTPLVGPADSFFRAVVSFGRSGIYAERLGDAAMRVCPVSAAEVRELIVQTRAAASIDGARGGDKLDMGAAAEAIAALSRSGQDHGSLPVGVDTDPVKVRPVGAVGLDALVVFADKTKSATMEDA